MADIRFGRVAVNGVALYLAQAGPADGRLLLLLHGFPEYSGAWHDYVGPLAAAGFHVVAPDQRGYGQSDKPSGIGAYDLDRLAADAVGLADHFGHDRCTIVGHDWGAAVGWWVATTRPERLERLVAMNAPHPAAWREAMQDHPVQRRLSRYVTIFRLPWLPELLLRRGRFDLLAKSLRQRDRGRIFTDADLDRYRAAWEEAGALTAMLNWYRALLRKRLPPSTTCRITAPVLLIWGERDAFAVRDLAEASLRLCQNGRAVYFPEAGHFVQHDEPERCREALLDFLRAA